MKVVDHTLYAGPHLFGDRPAVLVRLQLDADLDAGEIAALTEQAVAEFPELDDADFAACGQPGDGFDFPHTVAHLCNALHRRAGVHLPCVHRHAASKLDPDQLLLAYEEVEVALESVELALDWIERTRSGQTEASESENEEVRSIESFLRFAARQMLPVQDRALVAAARRLDVPAFRVTGRIVQFGQGCRQVRLSATKTTRTNVVSNDLAANKDYARRVLEDLGLPVPPFERVYRLRDVRGAAKKVGFPLVVKPNNGSMGAGVTVGVNTLDEAVDAYRRAREYGRSVLLEAFVEGDDYRMLVVDGKLIAAAKRVPGHIVGDGSQSVRELVDELNRDPRRGDGPTFSWTTIRLDDQADRLLAELGYDHDSVPAAGEVVYLRRNANTSDGGTAVDVTDDVHPDNREIAERTARAIGLDIAGVDFLTRDITKSMWKNKGRICEINSRPGIRKHMWPAEGRARDVATPILDMLFPAGSASRVPVIGVSGSGATRATAEMLQHVFSGLGYHVGARIRRRLRIDGRLIRGRGRHPFDAMRTLALDPDVDLIVFELAPGEIVDYGLPNDVFDQVVLLDDPAVDMKQGDSNSRALDLLARHTRGFVHLAQDDRWGARAQKLVDEFAVCAVVPEGSGKAGVDISAARNATVEIAQDALHLHDRDAGSIRIPRPNPASLASLEDSLAAQASKASVYAALCANAIDPRPRDIHRILNEFDASVLRPRARTRKARKAANAKAP